MKKTHLLDITGNDVIQDKRVRRYLEFPFLGLTVDKVGGISPLSLRSKASNSLSYLVVSG